MDTGCCLSHPLTLTKYAHGFLSDATCVNVGHIECSQPKFLRSSDWASLCVDRCCCLSWISSRPPGPVHQCRLEAWLLGCGKGGIKGFESQPSALYAVACTYVQACLQPTVLHANPTRSRG